LDYNDAIEDTSDKLLLRNILRARDKAPMHFGDIPLIHESLQLTSSLQSQILYGPIGKNTGRDFLTPNVAFQATPSFDINNLDTKDFVTGIASPIDAKYVKYWLDRGLDKRIIM